MKWKMGECRRRKKYKEEKELFLRNCLHGLLLCGQLRFCFINYHDSFIIKG